MPESQPEIFHELPAILSHKGRLAIISSMLMLRDCSHDLFARKLKLSRKHLLNAQRVMHASINFQCVQNHAREYLALAREHPPTAHWNCVNVREHIYSRASCVNHAREHVALTREHPLTARRKGVGAREYILASVKFKLSGTVFSPSI